MQSLEVGVPAQKVTYTRDGKMLAAMTQDVDGNALWRISADGRDRQLLTTAPLNVFMAEFSPDSQKDYLYGAFARPTVEGLLDFRRWRGIT